MALVAANKWWVIVTPLVLPLVLHAELSSVAVVHLPLAFIEILNAGRVVGGGTF